jgi:hypothetical protein
MDGKELLYKLRNLLNESADSGFMDDKTSYDYLNEAAYEFIRRTKFLRATQTITTVADQSTYDLNADFIEVYLRDYEEQPFIKINDGGFDQFIFWRDYKDIIYSNNTTSEVIPGFFSIINDSTLDTRLSSTSTSAGVASGGECTLNDTTADFSSVNAGDTVHNTTDGSMGVVLSRTSGIALQTALFNGADNDWSDGDSYVIQPQGKVQIILDAPPANAGYTITVHYIQRPALVYSDYGVFRIQRQYMDALVKYAYWLYKYRDSEPNFGDGMYVYFDRQTRAAQDTINSTYKRNNVSVNLKARKRGNIYYGR